MMVVMMMMMMIMVATMMHDDNDDDHVYDGDNYVHDDVLLVYLSLVPPGISGSVITGY